MADNVPLPALTADEVRVLDDVRRKRSHDICYPWLSAQDLRHLEFLKYYLAIRGRGPVRDSDQET